MPRATSVLSKTRAITLQTPVWVWCSGFLLPVFVSLCVFPVVAQYAAVEYALVAALWVVAGGYGYCVHQNDAHIVEMGWQGGQWQLRLQQAHRAEFCVGTLQYVWRTPWWIVLSFSLNKCDAKKERGCFSVWRSTCNPELWRALQKQLNRDLLTSQVATAKEAT